MDDITKGRRVSAVGPEQHTRASQSKFVIINKNVLIHQNVLIKQNVLINHNV